MVAAGGPKVPETLRAQLKIGGRLVIPVGLPYMRQELMLIKKDDENNTHVKDILGVAFVPLQEEDTEGVGEEATS